jgi:hypothetical protein
MSVDEVGEMGYTVGQNRDGSCFRSTRCWQVVQQTGMDAFRKVTASSPSMDVA